jgi:hypothetical protein
VVAIQHGSIEEDETRCVDFLRRMTRKGPVVVMTPDAERLDRLDLSGYKIDNSILVSNRHLLPEWQDVRLCVLR